MLSTEFFMIVTPVDLGIAHYSIPALARLVQRSDEFRATVYCNGLSPDQVAHIAAVTQAHARFSYTDNTSRMRSLHGDIRVGEWYTTEAGNRELREGRYENCGEIWSRELVKSSAQLIVTVDADFEVLDVEFALKMIDAVIDDESLAFYSTDLRSETTMYESYSQKQAVVAEVYATWFCVYRRDALVKSHDFTPAEEHSEDRLPVIYDHAARLQKALITDHGYRGCAIERVYRNQFLHYGAFAKNRTLSGHTLSFYRLMRIGVHNGWIHKIKSPAAAWLVRAFSFVAWKTLRMSRFDAERQRYLFD